MPVSQAMRFRTAAGGLAVCALLTACEPTYESVEILQPTGTLDRQIAARIVELVQEDSPLELNLVDAPDGMAPLDALEAGYADLAFASNSQRYRPEVSTVLPLYQTVLHILVRADEHPEDLGEVMAGKRVFAGQKGSVTRGIVRDLAEELDFADSGYTLEDEFGDDVDVVFVYAPIDRSMVRGETQLENFRLFSIGRPEDIGMGSVVDRATLLDPRLRPFVIPEGTYDALTPDPAVTVAVEKLLVARDDLDPALVHDLFGEILRIRPALFGERPELFYPIDDTLSSSNFTFSMHPGSVAYLNRDEPSFIERYSGVAEVLVTLLVGAVSGAWALLRIFRIRRKNRVDRFYLEVLRLRDTAAGDGSDTAGAIQSIRKLRDEAYTQLVDEQLAADESFRIFIELTNNTIEDLEHQASRATP